ncbi:MAG: hypothetical protein EHM20_04395 [Alphaproteobacteria bacterium]|nr:MAG: hypothetical protein EHM20_04395 [Alphaproteobacteria bacterium]
MKRMIISMTILMSFAMNAEETQENSKAANVKYKEAGRIDFESLLIEGERKKPELSVVTGNIGEKDNGLMVIRKDFGDMMANDFAEVIE